MEAKTIFPHPDQFSGYCQVTAAQKKHPIYSALRGEQDKTDRNRQRGNEDINH
jgi:hypothetical protein